MRISKRIAERMFESYKKVANAQKGNITENEFYSVLRTIDEIQLALNDETTFVGKYSIVDYKLCDLFKAMLRESSIRMSLTSRFRELADWKIQEGDMEISECLGLTIVSKQRADVELLHIETKLNEAQASGDKKEAEKVNKLLRKHESHVQTPEILSPSVMVEVQQRLLKELGMSQTPDKKVDREITTFRKALAIGELETRYSFNGVVYADNIDGFIPMSIKPELVPFFDIDQCYYSAEDAFVTWFQRKIA